MTPTTPPTRTDRTPEAGSVAAELGAVLLPLFGGTLPLRLRAWDGSSVGPEDAPTVVVKDPAALRRLVFAPGELGLAQAYVTGEIDVEGDLLDGFRRVWRAAREQGASPRLNPAAVTSGVRTAFRLGAVGLPPAPPRSQARLRGRLHSLRRDRDAIAHHYDLSNDFYALILDPHMAYSCAYFTSADPGYTLEDAQRDKLDLVCRKLGLEPGDAASSTSAAAGARCPARGRAVRRPVVGVTIAAEQKAFIDARIAERGLEDRVEIRLQDYRDVSGSRSTRSPRSRWASTSAEELPRVRRAVHRLLRPGGRVLVQQMSRTAPDPAAARSSRRSSPPTCTCARSARPSAARGGRARGPRRARAARALRPHRRRLVRHLRGQLGPRRRPGRRGGRPRVAALPRRRRAGVRGGPDGRRPDPRGPAVRDGRSGLRRCGTCDGGARHRVASWRRSRSRR